MPNGSRIFAAIVKELREGVSQEFGFAYIYLGIDDSVYATNGYVVEIERRKPAIDPEQNRDVVIKRDTVEFQTLQYRGNVRLSE